MLKAWAIREIKTGYFLTAKRGSFTFDEPQEGTPRLHLSKRSAQNTLTTWLQGRFSWRTVETHSWVGDYDYIRIPSQEKVSTRKRENMEIVEFFLMENK